MLSIVGTYTNGHLKLDKDYTTKKPVKVIVTFLEDIQNKSEKELDLSDFSFSKRKIWKALLFVDICVAVIRMTCLLYFKTTDVALLSY